MKKILEINLEHKDDVIREIEINPKKNLEFLHHSIIDVFGLKKNELASFYTVNNKLETRQEIPLLNFNSEDKDLIEMRNYEISSVLANEGDQVIYVYDFMKMWRFLITLKKEEQSSIKSFKCIKSIGEIPKNAPKLKFDIEDENHNYNNDADQIDYYE